MSRPILVGYDPRTSDDAPIRFGIAAARLTRARLIVASVQAGAPVLPVPVTTLPVAVGQVDEDLVADCAAALAEVAEDLGAEDVQFDCRQLRSTSAARALHEEAEAADAGLVVVGSSRHRGGERVVLGSTGERLLHGAPCPIAVVPPGWAASNPPATIGVGYVDTDEAREALRSAHALARGAHATLRVITVVKVSSALLADTEATTAGRADRRNLEDVEGEQRVLAEKELRRVVSELPGDAPVEVDAFVGDPAQTLVDLSAQLDVLVCGSRGYGPVRAVLLGSVSRRVVAAARCPVIVLPRGVKASLESLMEEVPGAAARAR
jgi:nucleotide-binding universal stress UspA family protein